MYLGASGDAHDGQAELCSMWDGDQGKKDAGARRKKMLLRQNSLSSPPPPLFFFLPKNHSSPHPDEWMDG